MIDADISLESIRNRVRPAIGMPCWHISCGGASRSTLHLSIGNKILRKTPLKNDAQLAEFRNFEGEVSIFVWCAWRLDGPSGPITSWDDTEESINKSIDSILGTVIHNLELMQNTWDMSLSFSNGLVLKVFCDHVPGEPSFDGNWDYRSQVECIAFGPGSMVRFDNR